MAPAQLSGRMPNLALCIVLIWVMAAWLGAGTVRNFYNNFNGSFGTNQRFPGYD